MRIRGVIGLAAFGPAPCASAHQPFITSFQPNGTITWSNIGGDWIAVVAEFSPMQDANTAARTFNRVEMALEP